MSSRLLLLVPALVLACGCTTTATRAIPDPPPRAEQWSRDDALAPGAYLGLETRANDSGRLDDLFFEPGVRVVRVDPHSPADRAGLEVGDVVLAWEGRELLEPASLAALVAESQGEREVSLEVRRGDTVFEVPVALRAVEAGDAAQQAQAVARVDPAGSRARWWSAPGGVRLVASDERAPFPRAGVPVGAIVHALDGREVRSARELIRLLAARAPGERVEVTFTGPDGEAGTVRVRLLEPPRVVTGFSVPVLATYEHDPDASRTSFVLLDLWLISLFRYTRDGEEREWRFLRFFSTSTGVGELAE